MKINFKNTFNTIKKSLEKSTSVIANLCQILIVVLAIFEYQKNIKPSPIYADDYNSGKKTILRFIDG